MNVEDSVFAKGGPQVEVLYVGPSLACPNATCMIQRSRGYEMYDILNMKCILCEPIYV